MSHTDPSETVDVDFSTMDATADTVFHLTPADAEAAEQVAFNEVVTAQQQSFDADYSRILADHGVNPDLSPSDLPYARAVEKISEVTTKVYLRKKHVANLRRLSPSNVYIGLRNAINYEIELENVRIKQGTVVGTKIMPIKRLGHTEIAQIVNALYSIILLTPSSQNSDPDLDVLAAYDDDPDSPTFGLYLSSQRHIENIVRRYATTATVKDIAEVIAVLSGTAVRRTRGANRDLIAVRNGIVDFATKKFTKFTPDHIFVAKLDVDWNPNAVNPVLDNPEGCTEGHEDPAHCTSECLTWDVESWMNTLSDDEGVPELLWEVVSAACRPYVAWNKAAFFFSTQGNNGKGTLLALMRNLLGTNNYANIPLADFGKEFLLEPLTRASAILVDENDVGTFVEKAAAFKAVVTNDVITINRKYKAPIAHQHFGFMVQCLNDKPMIKDKSESLMRRLTFIPFTKCFTGAERKYIKEDYLKRRDVLEYVLLRVLTMTHYNLSEPEAVKHALDDFRDMNDPIRAFWHDVRNDFKWDLVPAQFVFDLYVGWMDRNMPNSKPLGRNKFYEQLQTICGNDADEIWEYDHNAQHRPNGRIDSVEPMIAEFNLLDWADDAKRGKPGFAKVPESKMKKQYKALVRRPLLAAEIIEANEDLANRVAAASPTSAPIASPTQSIPAVPVAMYIPTVPMPVMTSTISTQASEKNESENSGGAQTPPTQGDAGDDGYPSSPSDITETTD